MAGSAWKCVPGTAKDRAGLRRPLVCLRQQYLLGLFLLFMTSCVCKREMDRREGVQSHWQLPAHTLQLFPR